VAPEDAFGEGTHRFALWTAHLQWRQPFELGSQRWQYQGQWRGQSNRTPLTPQDRFSIGGRYTVRGFDGQFSLSAERGWLLRNEVSSALSAQQQFFAALDHGEVGGPSAQNLLGTRLTGMALGLRGQVGVLQYEVFAGWPVDKPRGFRTANTTLGLSMTAQF
jgi:hemolysin activation/secretion protein